MSGDFLGTRSASIGFALGTIVLGVIAAVMGQTHPPGASVDGRKDTQYTAEYANYRFFNYGLNPNMAAGELYSFVGMADDPSTPATDIIPTLFIYYAQNPRDINDNTYQPHKTPGYNNQHITWTYAKGHEAKELRTSDCTEFLFYDRDGNVKLSFFADYVTGSEGGPGGSTWPYYSAGFIGGDGVLGVNDTGLAPATLEAKMRFESSYAWNLNVLANGRTSICGGDPREWSPPLDYGSPPNYSLYRVYNCPELEDWEFSYAIELSIPVYVFADEPIIEIVARAHNSPSKLNVQDVPPEPAQASIGDYVWFDWDRDGQQDSFENGIPNVRVFLYWDRDQDGDFTDKELIITTRTDSNGYYLFKGLNGGFYNPLSFSGVTFYNGQYKVDVDESTLPAVLQCTTNNEPYVLAQDPTVLYRRRTNLGVGEACRTADFGYVPNGGVIGDFVWSDANNNGIQDTGEVGIPGVTLQLLWASGPNAGQPVAGLASGNPVTTNSYGYYLFYGMTAGMYVVDVTDTNNVLQVGSPGGYVLTVGPESRTDPTPNITLATNGFNLAQDFGYYKEGLGKIGDTVFFDADWSTEQEAGEPGIANVTLGLWRDSNNDGIKDSSDQFLGSTVTDANGKYEFNGLPIGPGNIRYFVQVTDNNNVLRNYQKYYPGNYLFAVLSSSVTQDLDVDFPYIAVGLIGNFVWNDLDQDGIQDAGEPGIPDVRVDLAKDGAPWAYTLTNEQGYYEFGGLQTTKPGNTGTVYTVTVTRPSAEWSWSQANVGTDRTIDSNANPHSVTLGGGDGSIHADTSIDFGFYRLNATYYAIGDYIWFDDNINGLQDETADRGAAGVTVELRNYDTGATLQTTTTDEDGYYRFSGLGTTIRYTVVVTDIDGVLAGCVLTTDPEVMTPRVNGTPVVLSGDYLAADAGYVQWPTFVSVSRFRAFEAGGRVVVEWRTSAEINTAGFRVLRLDPGSGDKVPVSDQIVPALIGAPAGGTYRLVDPNAFPNQTYSYYLEELETKGTTQLYGPFVLTVRTARAQKPVAATFERSLNELDDAAKRRLREHRMARESASALKKRGSALKLFVAEDGLHFLAAAAIAQGLDAAPAAVQQALLKGQFTLSNQGEGVPYFVAPKGAGMYFYGVGPEGNYARENVYWLRSGKGRLMAEIPAGSPEATSPGTFPEILHFEQDTIAATALVDDPDADYWFWASLMPSYAPESAKTFEFRTPGPAPEGALARLELLLQGLTESPAAKDHKVTVVLNGTTLGEAEWDGRRPNKLAFSFAPSLLKSNDTNKLHVVGSTLPGVSFDIVLVDSFDVSYDRMLQADEDSLSFSLAGAGTVSIGGFSQSSITVLETTDPALPKLVSGVKVEPDGSGYRVVFSSSTPGARYLAVSSPAVRAPADVRADSPSELMRGKGADYVIITSGELLEETVRWADYKRSDGLDPLIVEVEDIMDEYNYGNFRPDAIRDFLVMAAQNWEVKPKYVLFLGAGSYDYRDIMGYGCNIVPTMMVGGRSGLFPSDTPLVDFDDDGIPELLAGRLPVMTPAELTAFVDKMAAYAQEADGSWRNRAVFLADDPDPRAGDFPADIDGLAFWLPPSFALEKTYLSKDVDFSSSRQAAIAQINKGCSVLNYIGHGAYDSLSYEGFLTFEDVPLLTNGRRLPVFTAWTCYVGSFGFTGVDCLASDLVLSTQGGAIAAVSPTGLTENAASVALAHEFFRRRFAGGTQTLGEVTLEALRAAAAKGAPRETLRVYGIIGDPALPVR